jgi:hypothetical protein
VHPVVAQLHRWSNDAWRMLSETDAARPTEPEQSIHELLAEIMPAGDGNGDAMAPLEPFSLLAAADWFGVKLYPRQRDLLHALDTIPNGVWACGQPAVVAGERWVENPHLRR